MFQRKSCNKWATNFKWILNQVYNILQQKMNNPKVISHRGRSDIYPQNTIEALLQGLLTSDLAQFDVILTKDNQVVVFHDRFLGRLTNIAFLPEFQNRKTVDDLNEFGQVPHAEWWVKEFTLNELRLLNVRQPHVTRPQIMDREFHIPTLDELLKKALQLKSTQQKMNTSGLLLQIKTQRQNTKLLPRDVIMLHRIHQVMKANNLDTKQKCQNQNLPVIVQSFNQEAIQKFYQICPNLPLSHLYYDEDENMTEQYIAKQKTPSSIAVAISAKHMTRQFVEMSHRMKYEVFFWSVVDDRPQIPFGCNSYDDCYRYLKLMNIDGIISDFAINCKKAISAFQA